MKYQLGPDIDDGIPRDQYFTTAHWLHYDDVNAAISARQANMSPAVGAGNTLYCGMHNRTLWALDGATGTKQWAFAAGDFLWCAPVVGSDGTVYAGTTAGKLCALDGATGIKRWEFPVGSTPSSVTLSASGTLYAGSASGKLLAITANAPGGLANSPWPKFRGNVRNTGSVVRDYVNHAPELIVPPTQTVDEGTTLRLQLAASDPLDPADSFTFFRVFPANSTSPAGVELDKDSGIFTWTPTEHQGPSTNLFTVRVTDHGAPPLSATNCFTVVVNEVNQAPVLPALPTQSVDGVGGWTLPLAATDPDIPANTLTYSLVSAPEGVTLDGATRWLSWNPVSVPIPSTNILVVRVTDNGTPPLSATNYVAVVAIKVNHPPVIDGMDFLEPNVRTNVQFKELSPLRIELSAHDQDPGDRLTYGLVSAPEGVALDTATGVLTWTPSEAQGPSTNVIVVQVTDDGTPPLSATNRVVLAIDEVNQPPVLALPPTQFLGVQTALTLQLAATDPDLPANTLTYSLVTAPEGMALETATGLLTWTPTAAQSPSTNAVAFKVTDNGLPPLSVSGTFTVIVTNRNQPPVLTTAVRNFTVAGGTTLVFTNTATDPDIPANTLVYLLGLDAPDGARLDRTTGVFTWTVPNLAATNRFTVWVTEDGTPYLSDSQPFTVITVPTARPMRFLSIQRHPSGSIQLVWEGGSDTACVLQYKTRLDDAQWLDVGEPVAATADSVTFTDPAPAAAQRFYRVIQKGN